MNKILTLNTIKNVFSSLGAKTSDSNYAVGLFDKTSAEPKGIMGMSDLASVLGESFPNGMPIRDITGGNAFVVTRYNSANSGFGFAGKIDDVVKRIGTLYVDGGGNLKYINEITGNQKTLDNFGCNTPADLASLLGGILGKFSISGNMTGNINLDDIKTNANYSQMWMKTGGDPQNWPTACGNGILIVVSFATGAAGVTYQVCIGETGVAVRGFNTLVVGWSTWKKTTLS